MSCGDCLRDECVSIILGAGYPVEGFEKSMKGKFIVAGAALSLAALLLVSAPAFAGLAGADRETFVDSSLQSCSNSIHKNQPQIPADTVKTYCSCMAEAEADMTTDADIQYMSARNEPPKGYRERVQALAPACKTKAGLK